MFVDVLNREPLRQSIFNAIVAPRPIAWVSSISASGVRNLAPFSYFNLLTSNPPTAIFSCTAPTDRTEKDTVSNIRETGEFVINLVSREMLTKMHDSSAPAPTEVDEFELLGIESAPSHHVKPSRVAAAPAALECRAIQYVEIEGDHPDDSRCTAIIGRVIGLHLAPDFIDKNGRFDTVKARLMARMGGYQYCELGEITELATVAHSD